MTTYVSKRVRTGAAAVAFLGFVGCSPSRPIVQNQSDVRTDTLFGFRLGMLLPDVRAAAAKRGIELMCMDAPGRVGEQSCLLPHKLDAEGQIFVSLNEGRVTGIHHTLGPDWRHVSVSDLQQRFAAYGDPGVIVMTPSLVIAWSVDSAYTKLVCSNGRRAAEGCFITVGHGTIDDLKRDVPSLQGR